MSYWGSLARPKPGNFKNYNIEGQSFMKKAIPYFLAIILAAFGLLTLFLSSSVIFDLFGIRAKEGNFVPFIVWANFACSILYLFAVYGFLTGKIWTTLILAISVLILIMALIGLFIHIRSGGLYETKTIVAMVFRIGITAVFALVAYFTISKNYRVAINS